MNKIRERDGGAIFSRKVEEKMAEDITTAAKSKQRAEQASQVVQRHILPFMPFTLRENFEFSYSYVGLQHGLEFHITIIFRARRWADSDTILGTVPKVRQALVRAGWKVFPGESKSAAGDRLAVRIVASKDNPRSVFDWLRRKPGTSTRVELELSGLPQNRCRIVEKEVWVDPVEGHYDTVRTVVCEEEEEDE